VTLNLRTAEWAIAATLFLCSTIAAQEQELSKATLDGQELKLIQQDDSAESAVSLRIGGANIALSTRAKAGGKGLRPDQPLKAEPVEIHENVRGATVRFGLDDGEGGVRAVLALLVQPKDKEWTLVREWAAESGAVGELGFKRETQDLENKEGGIFVHHFKGVTVEGLTHKMDCGCVACQSRTSEFSEDETLQWSASKAMERTLLEKWYTAQPGENTMVVARKALGDARLMPLIIKLNPELKDAAAFKGGEKILVERDPKRK
jgi:hypothetical protein